MTPIKIIIPGYCPVKKNTSGTSFYYKDKSGNKRLRTKADGTVIPLHFYSQIYQDWAKSAMIVCYNFRVAHPEITFPIQEKLNVKCLFFYDDERKRDLSNLLEAPMDVLSGNSGVDIKVLPPSAYQIIADDNSKHVGSFDGTRVLLDFINMRVEITLTDYIM